MSWGRSPGLLGFLTQGWILVDRDSFIDIFIMITMKITLNNINDWARIRIKNLKMIPWPHGY